MSSIDSQIVRHRRKVIRKMLREAGGSRKAVSQLVADFPDITIRQTEHLIAQAQQAALAKARKDQETVIVPKECLP